MKTQSINLQPPEPTALTTGRRDIVVIGAAIGGLTAVCKLLSKLPATFDAAILIALDMNSQPASSVLQILRGYSPFDVSFATDGVLVSRGRVLVSPAGHPMRVTAAGIVELEDKYIYVGSTRPVDRLFETAAAAYGRRVIGIVLSGASHDGTAGLTLIEAAGGVGVVQDPHEACDGSMSMSAIRSDHPDYCCTLDDMVPVLVKLTASARIPGRHPAALER